jgi:hypothetical protein
MATIFSLPFAALAFYAEFSSGGRLMLADSYGRVLLMIILAPMIFGWSIFMLAQRGFETARTEESTQ